MGQADQRAGSDGGGRRSPPRGRVALERVGGYLRGTAIMAAIDGVSDFIYLTHPRRAPGGARWPCSCSWAGSSPTSAASSRRRSCSSSTLSIRRPDGGPDPHRPDRHHEPRSRATSWRRWSTAGRSRSTRRSCSWPCPPASALFGVIGLFARAAGRRLRAWPSRRPSSTRSTREPGAGRPREAWSRPGSTDSASGAGAASSSSACSRVVDPGRRRDPHRRRADRPGHGPGRDPGAARDSIPGAWDGPWPSRPGDDRAHRR